MKIILVDNLVMPEEKSLDLLDVHPHLGLLSLAASAEEAGHSVVIYDPKRAVKWGKIQYDSMLYERVAAELLSQRPELVGFTTLGCSFVFAVNVAGHIKRKEPDLPVVLGGPHATMLDRQILATFPQFDIVVRHEADEIFPEVLRNVDRRCFDAIPGISWRVSDKSSRLRFTEGKPKIEDLDRLPIVSYDHYPISELQLDLLRIEAGRGCPFLCTFCSTAGFFQRSFRLKSAERLVKELDLLNERYGYVNFKLDHDMFTVNRRKVIEFCEAVQGRGYRWSASARIDCVDNELLRHMADAGCVSLYFGIETGSVRMQKICRKNLNLDLVNPILSRCDELGIQTTASFITGYPEELAADQSDTLDMLGSCFRASCLPQLHILAPEPGTPMFDERRETIRYDGYAGRYNMTLLRGDDERLVTDNPDIFQTYYFYLAAMPRANYIFAVETVDVLRRAGHVLVNYILRAFGGRLSKVVDEFRCFVDDRDSKEPLGTELFEAFLCWKFGPSHHLVSLFHIAFLERDQLVRSNEDEVRKYSFSKDQLYQLNPLTQILEDEYDYTHLLGLIASSPSSSLLTDLQVGERGTILLQVRGTKNIYRIDSGIKAILSLFETPRTCRDVIDIVQLATGLPEIGAEFFEDLLLKRIIVRCDIQLPLNNSEASMSVHAPALG